MFVSASAIASREPAAESIRAATGAWPIEVAIPSLLAYPIAVTAKLLSGS